MADMAVMSHLEGQELGGCRLVRRLSAGGMGEIYLAEQHSLGDRLVVVKIVRPGDPAVQHSVTQSLERLFTREGKLLGRFAHPNILPVHYGGMKDGLLYLVMQYAPDGSLADAIHGRSAHSLQLPLDLPFAVHIIGQIAAALQYTHDHGVVHRDVKPSNVLVQIEPSGRWHLLLADFGIAHSIDTTVQSNGATGTFAYMAPEQFSGRFSPASDQYSLGVMAHLLLTGRPPFQGDLPALMQAHLHQAPPAMAALNPALPATVEDVIIRALTKEPARRYPSVAAFAQALRAAALEIGATRPAPPVGLAMGAALATRGPWPGEREQPTQIVATTPLRSATISAANFTATTEAAPPTRPVLAAPTRPVAVQAGAAQASSTQRRRRRPLGLALEAAAVALLIVGLLAVALLHRPAPASVQVTRTPPAHTGYQGQSGASGSVGNPPATLGSQATAPAQQSSGPTSAAAPPTDSAQVVAQPAPITVQPGQQFTTSITFLNRGTTSWSTSAGYRLVCDVVRHPTSNCPPNVAVGFGQHTIAPGQRAVFTAAYAAPATPGVFKLWWNIAHNGALFTSLDAYVQVTVVAPQPQPTQPAAPQPASTAPLQPTPPAPAPSPTAAAPTAAPTTAPPQPTATPAATPAGTGAAPGAPQSSPPAAPRSILSPGTGTHSKTEPATPPGHK